MSEYHGSCHCGAVRFTFESEPIERGMRCNCSMCIRKGAVLSPTLIAEADLKIDADDDVLGMYQFGNRIAKHFFCRNCGIQTFNETLRKPGYYRVNLGCVEGIDALALECDLFDGRELL